MLTTVLILLVLAIFILALVPVLLFAVLNNEQRAGLSNWWHNLRLPWQQPADAPDDGVIDMEVEQQPDGALVAVSRHETPATQAPPERSRWERLTAPIMAIPLALGAMWSNHPWKVVAAIVLIPLLLFGMVYGYSTMFDRSGTFIVAIAPFDDGGDGSTGLSVANALGTAIREDATVRFEVVVLPADSRPDDPTAARRMAEQHHADVLIWGSVERGGMPNDTTLRPRITYNPNGAYAPNTWEGYAGRFDMVGTYSLSNQSINGQAVLPPLVSLLAAYSNGQSEAAVAAFAALQADYDLNSPLFDALRGNVAWATGDYTTANEAYRRALENAQIPAVALTNNLLAILIDADSPDTRNVLLSATGLPGSSQSSALQYNQGLLELREGATPTAIDSLSQALELANDDALTVPLLLDLGEAYYNANDLTNARDTLLTASQVITAALGTVPSDQRTLLRALLESQLNEQRAIVDLGRLYGTRRPLMWQIEATEPQAERDIIPIAERMQNAALSSETRASQWTSRAATQSADVALNTGVPRPEIGALAEVQVQRALNDAERQQYYYALLLTEQTRSPEMQSRGWFQHLMSNLPWISNPPSVAYRMFDRMLSRNPDDVNALLGRARTRLMWAGTYPSRSSAEQLISAADDDYNRVRELEPENPPAAYGKAMIALWNTDGVGARDFLLQATSLDRRYFPARSKLAQLSEQDGDWQTAIAQRSIIAEQYNDSRSRLELATTLRRSGQADTQAASILNEIASSEPAEIDDETRARAHLELGAVYLANGAYDDALAALDAADEIGLPGGEVALLRGQVYEAQGDIAQAQQSYARSARRAGNTTQVGANAHLLNGNLYASKVPADRQAAISEYDAALQHNQLRGFDALLGMSSTLLRYGRNDLALGACTQAAALPPVRDSSLAEANLCLAHTYLAGQNMAQTSDYANSVLDLTSDPALRSAALVILGDVQRLVGNLANAANLYDEALAVNPQNVDASLGLGLVQVSQDNWTVAQTSFQQATVQRSGQNDPLAYFWYGESLLRQGDLTGAIANYEQALALQPDFPEALLGKAQALAQQGNTEEALTVVNEALSLNRRYAEALLFRGRLLLNKGDRNSAFVAFDAAISADNTLPEPYFQRGMLRMSEGSHRTAASDLRRATILNPQYAEAHYWLGQAELARGNLDAAAQSLETMLTLPNVNPQLVMQAESELNRLRSVMTTPAQ